MATGINSKGMTLVEVVVAAGLIVLVVSALVATTLQSSVFSKQIDMVYVASNLAQRKIDMLKRFDFDHLPSAAETNISIDVHGNVDPDGLYRRTTEVFENHAGVSYLTRVKVSVGRVQVNADGTVDDPPTYVGTPIIFETLFSDHQYLYQ